MQATRFMGGVSRILLLAGALAAALPVNVLGDPPPWAPAHGWRKKHDPYYVGYTGKRWEHDYGVLSGRCNREAVGAVIGAAAGGVIGSQVGSGSGRKVAIIAGTIAGALIGARIGRDIDEADRACFGHALELVGDNKRVRWTSADGATTWHLTPLRGFRRDGRPCREFGLVTEANGKRTRGTGQACQASEGVWRIVG